MDLKDRYYDLMDKWDRFRENKLYTHVACAGMGVVIGVALAYQVLR
jgi:hypothetical protein